MPRIYLAGPINGCSDADANDWRAEAKRLLPWAEIADPMTRDYRGKEAGAHAEIVEGDLADIARCDAVLAACVRPSWGTAMELRAAYTMGLPVVGISIGQSPWLVYHCRSI